MSFLFMQKKVKMNFFELLRIIALLPFLLLANCESLKTRPSSQKSSVATRPTQASTVTPTPTSSTSPLPSLESDDEKEILVTPALPPPPAPVIPSLPKIGIILGAGGAKTYAHIGFLHELQKAKVSIHGIAGVEFAAPIAALYAHKEQANDVEWQMFKMKSEDVFKKSLLGTATKNNEATLLKDFIGTVFGKLKVDEFRVPFACPSYNLKKNQTFLMNRGGLDQVMYLCMAYAPFFKPYQNSFAGVRDVSAVANYLRSKGANYIVLVNVLNPPGTGKPYSAEPDSTDNLIWTEIAGFYNRPMLGIDSVVSLDTGNYGIVEFDKRREIMAKGAESATRILKNLTRKWGY